MPLLDEEARFPKGSDESFLAKVTEVHNKKNPHFLAPTRQAPCFTVKHYAGDVRTHNMHIRAYHCRNREERLITHSFLP
jgi:myosin heavy subunit